MLHLCLNAKLTVMHILLSKCYVTVVTPQKCCLRDTGSFISILWLTNSLFDLKTTYICSNMNSFKNEDLIVKIPYTACGADKSTHVFNHSKYWYSCLTTESKLLPYIFNGNCLRCCYQDCSITVQSSGSEQRVTLQLQVFWWMGYLA